MSRHRRRRTADNWKDWWEEQPPTRDVLLERLSPLVSHMQHVDDITTRIQRGNGCVRDLVDLEKTLTEQFSIPGLNHKPVCLVQPVELRSALSYLSRGLHLEVHAVDQYPCYLLCRISTNWGSPDTVLDELYVSTQHDFFPDGRFTTLLRAGQSRTFLRLSSFRQKLLENLTREWGESPDEHECDEVLETVAKLVLASAWYEDQRLPFVVADIFNLKGFRSATELATFILGSDLCAVAASLQERGEDVISFFRQVYENVPLADVLEALGRRGAVNTMNVETAARQAFASLNEAFSAFVSRTNQLRDLECLELYKVLLGCFGNLPAVAGKEYWTRDLEASIQQIEYTAWRQIDRLMPLLCGQIYGNPVNDCD